MSSELSIFGYCALGMLLALCVGALLQPKVPMPTWEEHEGSFAGPVHDAYYAHSNQSCQAAQSGCLTV